MDASRGRRGCRDRKDGNITQRPEDSGRGSQGHQSLHRKCNYWRPGLFRTLVGAGTLSSRSRSQLWLQCPGDPPSPAEACRAPGLTPVPYAL